MTVAWSNESVFTSLYQDNRKLDETPRFDNVTYADAGFYVCEVSVAGIKRSQSFQLVVEGAHPFSLPLWYWFPGWHCLQFEWLISHTFSGLKGGLMSICYVVSTVCLSAKNWKIGTIENYRNAMVSKMLLSCKWAICCKSIYTTELVVTSQHLTTFWDWTESKSFSKLCTTNLVLCVQQAHQSSRRWPSTIARMADTKFWPARPRVCPGPVSSGASTAQM